jgi:uncharacterized membrane protein YgaE (UPF0421/DUF939 family)
MIPLSTKAKEAIKIGISIVIGYYVALSMDWMSATWVATSIAFVSLPTAGQSIQKSAYRICGTLVAFVVGLFYLALFPQDRWLFILALTPYLFFIAYMVQGRNGQYFWFVAGFVTMMITTAGPGSSEHAFQFAAYRTLETMMGIGIWTVVSLLIWPRSNIDSLQEISGDLMGTFEKLMVRYRERAVGGRDTDQGERESVEQLRDRAGKMVVQLEQTVNAAAAESYKVRELRHHWRELHRLLLSSLEILDRLKSGFPEIQKASTRQVLVNEEALLDELQARFEDARRVLGGEKPARQSCNVTISLDKTLLDGMDHFTRAAVAVTKSELEKLDAQVGVIVDCVRDIEGYEPDRPGTGRDGYGGDVAGPFGFSPIDPDRIRGAIMVTASMWVGFLIWIYVNPPGHVSWYQFIPNITLVLVQAPFIRPAFLKPFGYAYVVGLVAFVFIMPALSVFWQLGILIFGFAFAAAYFFDGNGIGRPAIFLAMFNMLGIQNEQTYDFAAAANAFLFTMMALLVVTALSYILRSPRPEKAFVSMVGRFFRSCEFLLSRMAVERFEDKTSMERVKRAYHWQELQSLPGKLSRWGSQIDPGQYPGAAPAEIQAVVADLQVLVYRMQDLVEARQSPQAAVLVRSLMSDVREWRIVIEEGCRRWAEMPGAADARDLRERLETRIAKLEARFEAVLDAMEESAISDAEGGNFYRLLGGFRGVSEAAIVYADSASRIDWNQLKKERF